MENALREGYDLENGENHDVVKCHIRLYIAISKFSDTGSNVFASTNRICVILKVAKIPEYRKIAVYRDLFFANIKKIFVGSVRILP